MSASSTLKAFARSLGVSGGDAETTTSKLLARILADNGGGDAGVFDAALEAALGSGSSSGFTIPAFTENTPASSHIEFRGVTLSTPQGFFCDEDTAQLTLILGHITGLTSISFATLRNAARVGSYVDIGNHPDLLSVDLSGVVNGGVYIYENPLVTAVSCPALVYVDANDFEADQGDALTSISAPLLETIEGRLYVSDNPVLTTLSFPSLVSVFGSYSSSPATTYIYGSDSANLTTLSFPSLVAENAVSIRFSNCALTQASVDAILAICVANPSCASGSILLNGGTNATPSMAGLADKATLIGRGVTVNTN